VICRLGSVGNDVSGELLEMSVLVEAITVIIRNSTAEALIQGGADAIKEDAPNETFRTDGVLSAIGFTNPQDTRVYVDSLKQLGFKFVEDSTSSDIAVCDQNRGFTTNCDWLGTDLDERGVRYCWLLGEERGAIAANNGWTFENSMYTKGSFTEEGSPIDHLEFIREEGGMRVYWDKNKSEEVFITNTYSELDDIHARRLKQLLFYSATKTAYEAMIAEGWMSIKVNSYADAFPHLIMRYRNQLGLIILDVTWNGIALSQWDDVAKAKLIGTATESHAVPIVISFDLIGNPTDTLDTFEDLEQSKEIETNLRRPYIAHDLSADSEWSASNYDLDEDIELSNWELHDFGVQVVRESLERDGQLIDNYDSDMNSLVQIAVRIDDRPTYILVRTVCYPEKEASFDPSSLRQAATLAAEHECDLKIASVSLVNSDDPFEPNGKNALPIYRGKAVMPRFTGLSSPVIAMDG
jgi:hypothetical protein